MMAQDDLYFTPKKSVKPVKKISTAAEDAPAYHSGSNRDVDEYNRRGKFGSYYEKIGTDSVGNDIIEFHSSAEDSLAAVVEADKLYDADEDYSYSRRMSRFDDFYWYDPWFAGPYYGWHSPWWYSRWGWYDPWYYGYTGWRGWYDWYDPYYYSWYGWGYPYRWGWYGYSRPVYVSSRHYSPGYSRSTALYSRSRGYGGRYPSGVGSYRGDRSSTGNYSSATVNRGYHRDAGGSTPHMSSPSPTRSSMPSSGSFGSGSRGGGFSGGSRGGGGGVSRGGRR